MYKWLFWWEIVNSPCFYGGSVFSHQLSWLCCTARGGMLRIHCSDQPQSLVLSLLGKMNSHEATLYICSRIQPLWKSSMISTSLVVFSSSINIFCSQGGSNHYNCPGISWHMHLICSEDLSCADRILWCWFLNHEVMCYQIYVLWYPSKTSSFLQGLTLKYVFVAFIWWLHFFSYFDPRQNKQERERPIVNGLFTVSVSFQEISPECTFRSSWCSQ